MIGVNCFENKGHQYADVFIDNSRNTGLLHFTHELSVTFIRLNDKWKFESAWECGVSETDYDEKLFEETYPGLIKELIIHIEK